LELSDAEMMFRNWTGDHNVTRFLRWNVHKTIDDTKNMIGQWVDRYQEDSTYYWGIYLKTGEMIGSIGVTITSEHDAQGSLGYKLGSRWWNQGYSSEAARAVLDYMFLNTDIERIDAFSSVQNPASGKVMEKIGMHYEGLLQHYYKTRDGFHDCIMYGMIRTSWVQTYKEVSRGSSDTYIMTVQKKEDYSVYYQTEELVIRDLLQSDGVIFTEEENAQGWHTTVEKFEMRRAHQMSGECISLVAEYQGHPAGYVNVYPDSKWGALGNQGYPEIIDFAVLEKYRRHGIGSALMDIAEQIAADYADTVYLGVGMHNGYGSAQRLYVKRGYIPDGSGVWYQDKVCTPYDSIYTNDDDLVLYLVKKLG